MELKGDSEAAAIAFASRDSVLGNGQWQTRVPTHSATTRVAP